MKKHLSERMSVMKTGQHRVHWKGVGVATLGQSESFSEEVIFAEM